MVFPFIGGRIKPDLLTENICQNLCLTLKVNETASVSKAWDSVKSDINQWLPVGLKLDSYYLEYFSTKIHFAGHYVAMYGYDETHAYLIDTKAQGSQVKTSLESLAQARSAKGPMSSKNLFYTINNPLKNYSLPDAILKAIRVNAQDFLHPPIQNIGYKGILKTSHELKKWFETSNDVERDFKTTAMLMEQAGTGWALFRNLYRDFLQESYEMIGNPALKTGYEMFRDIALLWSEVASLLDQAWDTKDLKYILKASHILSELSEKEKEAMEKLASM